MLVTNPRMSCPPTSRHGDDFSEGITETVTGAMCVMFGNNSNFGIAEHEPSVSLRRRLRRINDARVRNSWELDGFRQVCFRRANGISAREREVDTQRSSLLIVWPASVVYFRGIYLYPLTIVGGVRYARYCRHGRGKTVCARGSNPAALDAPDELRSTCVRPALLGGPSAHPLDARY